MAWGGRQQAMETAQHWDRLPKNQPAEITMFQISEVQESPACNGRLSFLTLQVIALFCRVTRSKIAQQNCRDNEIRWRKHGQFALVDVLDPKYESQKAEVFVAARSSFE